MPHVETDKTAADSCYVLRQFLTPLPSIDFREIWGLYSTSFRIKIHFQEMLDLNNVNKDGGPGFEQWTQCF
jgi:hypothetical protein